MSGVFLEEELSMKFTRGPSILRSFFEGLSIQSR